MTTDQEYISDEDQDYLDNFLLDRIDENADTEGKDEGILGLADLDVDLTLESIEHPERFPLKAKNIT